ncbi:Death-associated inhibitor of apoptosis 2 [Gryllus bimaculatus]|nr:Death-associated inhibitor of apoptosis 2 [Gryllus bimaculatus]
MQNLFVHQSTVVSNFMASRELNMEDEANRLSTFGNRPNPHVQPNDLTACGFFYSDVCDLVKRFKRGVEVGGNDDTTLCFHCGKDVCEWTSNDDPWVEHALFSPKCSYVLLNKGIGFVDNVFKMRGSPKSKKDLKLLQLPERLKGMIDIRDHADLHSRSARKSEATKGPFNQKAHGSGEPVRSVLLIFDHTFLKVS